MLFIFLVKFMICLFLSITTTHSCCCIGALLAKQALSSAFSNDEPDFVERIITSNMKNDSFGCRENEIEDTKFAFPVITAKGLRKYPTLIPKMSKGHVIHNDSILSSILERLPTNSQKTSHMRFDEQVGSEFAFPSSQGTELICKLVSFELYCHEPSSTHEHAQKIATRYHKTLKERDFTTLLAEHNWTKLQLDVEKSTAQHFVFSNKSRDEIGEGYQIIFDLVREKVPLVSRFKRAIMEKIGGEY